MQANQPLRQEGPVGGRRLGGELVPRSEADPALASSEDASSRVLLCEAVMRTKIV